MDTYTEAGASYSDDSQPGCHSTLQVVVVENPEVSINEEMTARERQKIKNREAAQKCRNKRKERENKLSEENNRLKSENTVLKYKVKQWRMEAERLRTAIKNHLATCAVPDVILHQMVMIKDSMMAPDGDDNDVVEPRESSERQEVYWSGIPCSKISL